jgi:hypothetical protein
MNRLLPKERAELEAAQSHLNRAEQLGAWYQESANCVKRAGA